MKSNSTFNPIPLAYRITQIAWWFVLAGLLIITVSAVWTHISEDPIEFSFNYATDLEPLQTEKEFIGEDQSVKLVITDLNGSISLHDLARTNFAASLVFPILYAIFMLLMLWGIGQLRDVLFSAKHGDIFTEKNFERIRIVALLIMAIDPIHWVYSGLKHIMLSDLFEGSSYHMVSTVDISYLAIGLVVLTITQILKRGYELEQEQKLTI